MSALGALQIAGVVIGAVDKALELKLKSSPSWEQKRIMRWKYLKDLYAVEKNKPDYDDTKTPEENVHARSTDRMLNLRDECVRYGEALIQLL
jgi:hypothetical protein